MTLRSAIYRGEVVHTRHRPKRHKLRYRVFSLLLDLDEIEALSRKLRLFGYNRSALFSFHDKDHGALEGTSLRDWVNGHLQSAGIDPDGIRVSVLCYPRILGYVFNPLTVYFCRRPDGSTALILYEVCNTFNERHTYVLPVSEPGDTVRHSAQKALYVSPFTPMDCAYHFRIGVPEEKVRIEINEDDPEGPLLYAGFTGKRHSFSDRALVKAFLAYPLMTLKVMVGIHFEALRLWMKGLRVFRHEPASQRVASSLVATENRRSIGT